MSSPTRRLPGRRHRALPPSFHPCPSHPLFTQASIEDVEPLLLRALALELIRGSIDEVNQTIQGMFECVCAFILLDVISTCIRTQSRGSRPGRLARRKWPAWHGTWRPGLSRYVAECTACSAVKALHTHTHTHRSTRSTRRLSRPSRGARARRRSGVGPFTHARLRTRVVYPTHPGCTPHPLCNVGSQLRCRWCGWHMGKGAKVRVGQGGVFAPDSSSVTTLTLVQHCDTHKTHTHTHTHTHTTTRTHATQSHAPHGSSPWPSVAGY